MEEGEVEGERREITEMRAEGGVQGKARELTREGSVRVTRSELGGGGEEGRGRSGGKREQ